MRATTRGERTNAIRVINLACVTLCHDQIFARYRSPLHIRRTGASPAIDTMTIDQCKWPALQHVSCPATDASTTEFHIKLRYSLSLTQDWPAHDENVCGVTALTSVNWLLDVLEDQTHPNHEAIPIRIFSGQHIRFECWPWGQLDRGTLLGNLSTGITIALSMRCCLRTSHTRD